MGDRISDADAELMAALIADVEAHKRLTDTAVGRLQAHVAAVKLKYIMRPQDRLDGDGRTILRGPTPVAPEE